MDRPMHQSASPPGQPILVVDDDHKIVALVRTYLEREGYHTLAAHDGHEALKSAREHDPALIVLDLMLPGIDGLEVARLIRADSDVPILMLSARSAVADRIRGLERGADDYLPKPFSPAELVVRVRAILRRSAHSPPDPLAGLAGSVLTHGDLVVDVDRHEVRRSGTLIDLTNLEFRLLSALLAAEGRVLTRDQLLDAVYGRGDGEVLDRTIDVIVGRLREKLGDDATRPRYVATVRGTGYRAAPTRGAAGA
jgi:DNA-binding response OmpR family regulator